MSKAQKPKAFISCSLREEDKQFIDFILKIVRTFGFEPFGTVGKYTSEPKSVWQSMKENIEKSDCAVIVATPRYIQQDVNDKTKTGNAISEMIHTEVGMAVMTNRPVLVFVQEGTDPGSFITSLVQYITVKLGDKELLKKQWPLIESYFKNAIEMIQHKWDRENKKNWKTLGLGALAIIGTASLIDFLFSNDDYEVYEEYQEYTED